jgi:hypothetical protein
MLSNSYRWRGGAVVQRECSREFRSCRSILLICQNGEHRTTPEWGLLDLPFERIGPERVMYHAQKQTSYRPDENATY